jgi:hypothetical protein
MILTEQRLTEIIKEELISVLTENELLEEGKRFNSFMGALAWMAVTMGQIPSDIARDSLSRREGEVIVQKINTDRVNNGQSPLKIVKASGKKWKIVAKSPKKEAPTEKKYEMPTLSKEQIKGVREEIDKAFSKLSSASDGEMMLLRVAINKIHVDLQKLANNAFTGDDSDKLLIYAKASYLLQQSRVAYGEMGEKGFSEEAKRYFLEVEHDFSAALAKVEDNFAKKLIFNSEDPRLEGAASELDYKHQDGWQLQVDAKNKEKEAGEYLKKANIEAYKMGKEVYMTKCSATSDPDSVKVCNLTWDEIVRSATSGNKK